MDKIKNADCKLIMAMSIIALPAVTEVILRLVTGGQIGLEVWFK